MAAANGADEWRPPVPADLTDLSKESEQQRYIVRYLAAHPKKPLFYAPCNEADGQKWNKWEPQGRLRGVCDLIIDYPTSEYHGLRIELKRRGGRASELQLAFIRRSNEAGYKAVVCAGFERALEVIDEYLA